MKRLLLALVPWMAMTSAVGAQTPADVVFTYHGLIHQRCVRVGDECFVPFDSLSDIGWSYTQKGDSLEIKADDQMIRVSVRDVSGTPMVPLRYAMEKLGGESSWVGDRLMALSSLNQVRIRSGALSIRSSLPVKATVFTMNAPKRVVLDLQGAKLTTQTDVDLDGTSRIAQYKPDVVRVVLECDFDPKVGRLKLEPGTSFEFDVNGTVAAGTGATTSKEEIKDKGTDASEARSKGNPDDPDKPVQKGGRIPLTEPQKIVYDPASDPDMPAPILVSSVAAVGPLIVDSEGAKATAATLRVTGLKQMPTFRRPEPKIVEIVIPCAKPADGVDFTLAKGPTIRDATVRSENGSMVLALTLSRPMGIEFSTSPDGLQIQFLKPEVGNGRLAGKVVVVDAGHGGHDQGTQSAGINEKDLTLSIAKLLSQKLANEGATVIMTRKTDVFISLSERPAIANRNGADFFVSVHINSNELDNTASGSITFFHAHDPICQLMADCIQREIVKVNGIGGMGVWSDQRIYRSGFAVLRGAKMPAVLVECGFLNTQKDRATMLTDGFQDGVASAIVKGLKDYLGDEGKEN